MQQTTAHNIITNRTIRIMTSQLERQSRKLTVSGPQGDDVAGLAVAGTVVALHSAPVPGIEVEACDATVGLPSAVGVLRGEQRAG